jgi:hypothetical protein
MRTSRAFSLFIYQTGASLEQEQTGLLQVFLPSISFGISIALSVHVIFLYKSKEYQTQSQASLVLPSYQFSYLPLSHPLYTITPNRSIPHPRTDPSPLSTRRIGPRAPRSARNFVGYTLQYTTRKSMRPSWTMFRFGFFFF